jgi:flagellar hook protein FlgE
MTVSSSLAALSGLMATNTKHNVTAHNVANINTDEFQAQRANQVENSPTQGTSISDIQRIEPKNLNGSNTDLAKESVNQLENISTYKANVTTIKTQDGMDREVIDLLA